MVLRDWIINSGRVATATIATSATPDTKNKGTVASVATVTVASDEKAEEAAMTQPDNLTSVRRHDHADPGRTWAPGNPFTCKCGFATGWLRDGKPLCPVCDVTPAPAGAITTAGDCITFVTAAPGICPLCGNRLDQDGGDCWHRSFHLGVEESAGAPPSDDKPTPAPITCENQGGPSCGPKMGMRISPVALSWLRKNRAALALGWTKAELYRRNKSRGIAWVGLWDHPGLSVAIESGGTISFSFKTPTGQTIRQTAWPKKHQRKGANK
jgi:hypothetical protein